MAETEERPESPKVVKEKEYVATKVTGTVKWFNVKSGYGFINRDDTKEDIFIHQTAITKNNPKKSCRSVGDGEVVEFDVIVGTKGFEAANVTGPEGANVEGSPYAADRRKYRKFKGGRFFGRRRPRPRGPLRDEEGSEGEQGEEGGENSGDGSEAKPRRFNRRPRPWNNNTNRRPRRNFQKEGAEGEEGGNEEIRDENNENENNEDRPNNYRRRFYYRRWYKRPQRNRTNTEGSQSGGDGEAQKDGENQQKRPQQPRKRFQRRGPPNPRKFEKNKEKSDNSGENTEKAPEVQEKATSDSKAATVEEGASC